MSISVRLRLHLNLAGKSIKEFSDQSLIPYRTVQEYLSGKRKPGSDHLVRMHEAGVPIVWLLTGELENSLSFTFEHFDAISGILGASPDICSHFAHEAIEIVDDANKRLIEEGKEPLHVMGIITSIYSVLYIISDAMDHVSDKVLKMKKLNWSDDEIVSFFMKSMKGTILDRLKTLDPDSPDFHGRKADTHT